ncbi:uncharacterized protein DEA37_0001698 [Paragonimus westermani]|uniref:Uncharacterized protein n=1 Tax=Paragonimus westermani TaxID=34504 RepID=A0A5J4N7Q3_9TREM|nr:uncharacterized protein DEA37_0001698 [Paragonimus westermani]
MQRVALASLRNRTDGWGEFQTDDPERALIYGRISSTGSGPTGEEMAGYSCETRCLWALWEQLVMVEGILHMQYRPTYTRRVIVPQTRVIKVLEDLHRESGHIFMGTGLELRLPTDLQTLYVGRIPILTTEYAVALRQESSTSSPSFERSPTKTKGVLRQNAHRTPLLVGAKVYLHTDVPSPGIPAKLHREWKGTFVVVRLLSSTLCYIRSSDKCHKPMVVHFNRLKPAETPGEAEVAEEVPEIGAEVEIPNDVPGTLGEKRLTTPLVQMQQLIGNPQMDVARLLEIWLQRLPEAAQAIVSFARSQTVAETAKMIDQVVKPFQPLLDNLSKTQSNPCSKVGTRGPDKAVALKSSQLNIEASRAEIAAPRRGLN